jgi:isopenicillin N synthase-like dioxygenase
VSGCCFPAYADTIAGMAQQAAAMYVARIRSGYTDRQGRRRDYESAYLRRTYRDGSKVKHETLANLSGLDVPTSADHPLINCGTYMSHLTNGYFMAPVHRVKWVNAERLSLPFFVHAGNDTVLEPFHPDGVPERGNQAIRYSEFLQHGLEVLIKKNGQT